METEKSEVRKVIYEGAEVYLNGVLLGNGCEVETPYEETPYEEAWDGEMGPSKPRPAKRTFKITVPEEVNPLRRDWIVKHYTQDGSVREATFSDQEEAQRVMQIFRGLDLEGHFELVCRPRVEEVVVDSYRNEPVKKEGGEALSVSGFDRDKSYRDESGDIWTYLSGQSGRGPGWYFQEEERGHRYGPFYVPIGGHHEEVPGEGAIIDPRDLLKSKQYLDSDGCVWKFRIHQGSDRPSWHFRVEGSPAWDPIHFSTPTDGPWTEYEGED